MIPLGRYRSSFPHPVAVTLTIRGLGCEHRPITAQAELLAPGRDPNLNAVAARWAGLSAFAQTQPKPG